MRLGFVLWRKKMPNGHIHRGKHKLQKPITPLIFAETKRKLEIEDKNMFFLRHPYITLEQDQGHGVALGKKEIFMEKCRELFIKKKSKPHITLEERLFHLKVKEAWD